jgi:hypothetical protein
MASLFLPKAQRQRDKEPLSGWVVGTKIPREQRHSRAAPRSFDVLIFSTISRLIVLIFLAHQSNKMSEWVSEDSTRTPENIHSFTHSRTPRVFMCCTHVLHSCTRIYILHSCAFTDVRGYANKKALTRSHAYERVLTRKR